LLPGINDIRHTLSCAQTPINPKNLKKSTGSVDKISLKLQATQQLQLQPDTNKRAQDSLLTQCSIVIPYKDRIDLLRWTLRALRQQKTKRIFEVVVVDDGSEFSPRKQLSKKDLPKKISFLKQENKGSAAARNTGWLQAKGEIVIFLDCDQITKPDFVENHCALFDAVDQPLLQIATRRNLPSTAQIKLSAMADVQFLRDERMHFFQNTSFNMGNLESAWHHCFSHNISTQRENLIRHGGFDSGFRGWGFEDCEIGYKFKKAGVPLVLSPGPITFHQYHEQRMNPDKFALWKDNLNYFIAKHDNAEVDAQKILVSATDPENHTAPKWKIALLQFENILRLQRQRRLTDAATNRQKISTYDGLRRLAETKDVYQTMALVDRKDLGLIGKAQLDPILKEVRLFFA